MELYEKDKEKVISEISECQGRILQTLIPTIIAVGLISIADREKFALITSLTAFAILFASSLYVASLSYKIFRNATFLRAVNESSKQDNVLHWEDALSKFNKLASIPSIIGYETKTIATIYIVFSLTYIFMFYSMQPLLTCILGSILILIALRLLFIPNSAGSYYEQWKTVLNSYYS